MQYFQDFLDVGGRPATKIWRRRRDSNPRYALRAYNGLANRRLQPLGHISVKPICPRLTAQASGCTGLCAETEGPEQVPSAIHGTSWRHRQTGFSGGITSDAGHDDPTTTTCRKPRGAGERWRKSFNGCPLTTGAEAASCTSSHLTAVGGSRALSLSLADALCRRLRRHHGDRIATLRFCKFASDITVWT
jgi:hypothetical protein